jgi:hypothetical protein
VLSFGLHSVIDLHRVPPGKTAGFLAETDVWMTEDDRTRVTPVTTLSSWRLPLQAGSIATGKGVSNLARLGRPNIL